MSAQVTTNREEGITRFGELIRQSIAAMTEACQLYVADIDADPTAADAYRAAYPDIPAASWVGFESLGRGAVIPQLLWSRGPGPRALARLPISEQRRYIDSPAKLLTVDGDTLLVATKDMNTKQVRQVFASDHVRTLGEQRAWLESQRKPEAPQPLGFEVKNNKLIVREPIEFTRKQLQQILAGM
jgi:hypothetical protein